MKRNKVRKIMAVLLVLCLCFGIVSCGKDKNEEVAGQDKQEIQLFVAASLSKAMEEIKAEYEKQNPGVKVSINADGSGKLKTQIMEGFDCNLFFSASENEMVELGAKNLIDKKSVKNVLGNRLALVGYKDYDGQVKGLDTISKAKSIALPYGSVPAGFYARKAMIANGTLKNENLTNDDIKKMEGSKISKALGDITISEKDNVNTVVSAIAEKSCEVGFAYTSDINKTKDVKVIEEISPELSGKIVYPLVKVVGKEELPKELNQEVDKLYEFLMGDFAKKTYEKYGFLIEK
ncbi:MAG: molybdate ABC transporter substrate-binding protein [Anaerovoracaceae bacterium]